MNGYASPRKGRINKKLYQNHNGYTPDPSTLKEGSLKPWKEKHKAERERESEWIGGEKEERPGGEERDTVIES